MRYVSKTQKQKKNTYKARLINTNLVCNYVQEENYPFFNISLPSSPTQICNLTLRPLRTSILVPPAAYVSCWGVAGAATHLSAVTQSCLLCRVASRESCPTFIPFRHDKNIEWYGYCSFVF